jgi:hypothetical protein
VISTATPWVWDYDPQGATPDRRRSHDTSTNGHGSLSRDRGSSSPDPTSSPIGTKNTNNRKDGARTSLSSKKSRMSILGLPSPAVSLSQSGIPMSINRKRPQPTSQSTSHGGTGSQSGLSTPPRSSTPSLVPRAMSGSCISPSWSPSRRLSSFSFLFSAPLSS